MRHTVILLFWIAACGRIGYEERRGVDAAPDVVVVIDAAIDAPPVCPLDTLPLSATSNVCIEIAQRGSDPWTFAKATCEAGGRRLCADLEWYEGCTNQPTLMNMVGDDYEWVAEESGGIAQKRGSSSCDDMSAHQVVDPYGWRCCVEKK